VLSHRKQTKAIAAAHLKNDRVQAERLLLLLQADLLPTVWIPPREIRGAGAAGASRAPHVDPNRDQESARRAAGSAQSEPLRREALDDSRRPAELAQRAEQEGLSHRHFLALLMAEVVAHWAQTRIQRCVRRARVPFLKTIDEYDFTCQSGVHLAPLGSALSPEFVTART
jgi:hypothetical protein